MAGYICEVKLFTTIVMAFAVTTVFAQKCDLTLQGSVVDFHDNSKLDGATIVLAGLEKAVITDLDGNFVLADIPLGRYDIEASDIGHEPVQIPEIVLTSSKEVVLNIDLNEMSTNLGEVVIKPRIIKNAYGKMFLGSIPDSEQIIE